MHATDKTLRDRKTCKVLSDVDLPIREQVETLHELVQLAGLAPFHRPCDDCHRPRGGLDGIEPWRFYVVDAARCRQLKHEIPQENAGKIPAMLAAADALIMATWLPNPSAHLSTSESPATVAESRFEPTLANMEHIAAASAAIQNLLLAATTREMPNYWSSGGVLRSEQVFELLGIPFNQILLGAIFLFPSETSGAQVVGSKLREHRTTHEHWTHWS